MPRIFQIHPSRCEWEHTINIGGIFRFIPRQHLYASHFPRLPLLFHPQQDATRQNVGGHKVSAAEEGAEEGGDLLERLVTVLIGMHPTENPLETTLPETNNFAVAEGFPGARGFLDFVVPFRAQRVKDHRQAKDGETEKGPIEYYQC